MITIPMPKDEADAARSQQAAEFAAVIAVLETLDTFGDPDVAFCQTLRALVHTMGSSDLEHLSASEGARFADLVLQRRGYLNSEFSHVPAAMIEDGLASVVQLTSLLGRPWDELERLDFEACLKRPAEHVSLLANAVETAAIRRHQRHPVQPSPVPVGTTVH